MTNQEKLDFILETLQKVIKKNINSISPEMTLTDDLGLDSLDIVEVQIHYEETFDVRTEDSQVYTIQDLMDLMA
jgi:acyl carrier protein